MQNTREGVCANRIYKARKQGQKDPQTRAMLQVCAIGNESTEFGGEVGY